MYGTPRCESFAARHFLSMMKKNGNKRSSIGLPPVEHITLQDGKRWRTGILVVLLLAAGLFFLGRGVKLALTRQGGWTEIQARTGSPGCAQEFEFWYCLDQKNGNAEYRALTTLYTDACERAAKVYSSSAKEEGLGNLAALNSQPNQEISLEPELYRALEEIQSCENRVIYLAPLYEYYTCLFFCEREEETLEYDPLCNVQLAEEFGRIAAFASDPDQIDMQLLGENRARLHVSQAYLDYAAENGYASLVDLGWMKNAFVLDDLVRTVRDSGFHNGYIQSAEGYGYNLCENGESFSINVFDRAYGGDCVVAQMSYTRPLSFLSLHSYTNSPRANDLYYELSNGEVRSIYVDPRDGMPKTAGDDLLLWSDDLGCGELVLRSAAVFIGENWEQEDLDRLGCFYAFCEDRTLYCSDPLVDFPMMAEDYVLRQAD